MRHTSFRLISVICTSRSETKTAPCPCLLSRSQVFCNNYLDGGYHVPFAHGALAAGIDMTTCALLFVLRFFLVSAVTNAAAKSTSSESDD